MKPVIYSVNEVFTQLTPTDEKILISLPYRVGLFVSFADVTGGWEAQDKENQTLVAILKEFSQDFFKTELMQKILMDTLESRQDWLVWSRNLENLPQELSDITNTLSTLVEPQDFEQFKEVLVDVALSVAMAFRENMETSDTVHGAPMIRQLISKLMGDRKLGQQLSHVNISDAEKAALKKLCDSMGYKGL